MYIKGILPKEKVTKTLLSLTGLFENIYEMTYYIPELSYKLGVLKNNEIFCVCVDKLDVGDYICK